MDDQAAQEEIERLRQEIQDIDKELARIRSERRLFGRSSFSPEWLILRQRTLQTERDRCQVRLRELARAGHKLPRRRMGGGRNGLPVMKTTVYAMSGIVVILAVAAFYMSTAQGRSVVAPPTRATPTVVPTATAIPSPTATPTPSVTIYKVAPGDSLSKIAQQYGVSIDSLLEANKLTRASILQVGQEIIIPPGASPTPAR